MKIYIQDIKHNGAVNMWIHSFESGIYLVEAEVNDEHRFVVDDSGSPVKFRSVKAVKEAFSDCDIKKLWLVEESAYEEMIGLAQQPKTQLCVQLHF